MTTGSGQDAAPSGYRADIDGLRALAIGLVVVFHFKLIPIGQAGFIGVDIFFVISGFLITRIIADGLAQGRFRLSTFYYRRIRRLYPAMLATLFLYLGAGYLLLLPDMFEELGRETVLSQLYVVNFYFWREINYFGLQADTVPLLHMWSLAVEEQFYLIFPLVMMGLYRFARGAVIWVVALFALASFGLGWFASGWKPQAAFYLLPTRAWELMAGGLLALALLRGWRPAPAFCRIAGGLGLAVIAGALWYYGPGVLFPGWYAALPVAGAVLLIIGGQAPDAPVTRLMSLPPLVFLGAISYPLYLVHWPVLILMTESLQSYDWGWRAAGLGLSILLAWGIYALIERPLRHGAVLPRPRPFLVAAFSATGLLVAWGVWGVASNGVPDRFAPRVNALLAYSEDEPTRFDTCGYRAAKSEPFCPIGTLDAPRRAVLVGDSHSKALAGAMDLFLQARGEAGGFAFSSACMPVTGVGPGRCTRFAEGVVAAALADPEVERVYLVSIWRQPEGDNFRVNGAITTGPAAYAGFQAALLEMAARLQAGGKQVIFVEPLFAAPSDVPQTLAKNLAFGRDWPVDRPLEAHRAEFARLTPVLEAAEQAGVVRLSLIEELCASGTCKALWQERPLFTDNNHLGFGLSSHFADILAQEHIRLGLN